MFLVKKYNVDRVEKPPIEFRDKTLCNIDGADVTEISVAGGDKSYALVKSGADWKATKPKMDVDASKVTPITNAFKDWKATGFAEDQSTKSNGLAKPKVITAKSKAKGAPVCQVKVGDETKDKLNYFVATPKGDVLLAPKWSVDRILVKPDDLKKPTVAKK